MSIRTLENLSDAISIDLAWRKKELSTVRFLVEKQAGKKQEETLLRCGIAILYAHWEGFIKASARAYLEFVSFQRLKYQHLAPNFVALAARRILRTAANTDKVKAHIDVTDFYLSGMSREGIIPYKTAVPMRANLNSELLKEITLLLGISYAPFEAKAALIDERLLGKRNTIAHGEYLEITRDLYVELGTQIISLMDRFRADIENAAVLGLYKVA